MILEIDDRERDTLILALARSLSAGEHPLTCKDLLVKVAALPPDEHVTMDVSTPGYTHCSGCNYTLVGDGKFEHRPGCEWVRRYG